MFNSKPKVTELKGRRDDQSQTTTGRPPTFQVPFGRESKLCLRILGDRVKRTLFLYDPRASEPDGFVRIRLPDGELPPCDQFLQHQSEGVIIQWALEDADCYLDCEPMKHAHVDADDGAGMPIRVRETKVAPPPSQPTRAAAPMPEPEPTPEPAPAASAPQQPAPPAQPEGKTHFKKKPDRTVRGIVKFVGIRAHTRNGRSFHSYTVDLHTAAGQDDTFCGQQLEDRVLAAGVRVGDDITIHRWNGRGKGKPNLFKIEKHS